MAVVCSKVLLFDPPLIYTAPDTCVFGAVEHSITLSLYDWESARSSRALLLYHCLSTYKVA